MIIAPLLFSTLVVGIAGTGDMKTMGRIGLKAIIYFESPRHRPVPRAGARQSLPAWRRHGAALNADTKAAAAMVQSQQHAGHPAAHVSDLGDRFHGAATSCRS
jgi:hypothetical protein